MVFENRKDSSLQMGKKGTISIRVPSAAQFATGQNTSVIRFLVTIPNVVHRQQALKQRVFRAALVAHQPCLKPWRIKTSSDTAHVHEDPTDERAKETVRP